MMRRLNLSLSDFFRPLSGREWPAFSAWKGLLSETVHVIGYCGQIMIDSVIFLRTNALPVVRGNQGRSHRRDLSEAPSSKTPWPPYMFAHASYGAHQFLLTSIIVPSPTRLITYIAWMMILLSHSLKNAHDVRRHGNTVIAGTLLTFLNLQLKTLSIERRRQFWQINDCCPF